MRIEIVGQKYDVGNRLEELINKKIQKQIGRYFKDSDVARVVCKEEHGRFKMEITIIVGDTYLRAEHSGDNMYENLDIVVPKVERQMRKLRTKYSKRIHESEIDLSEVPEETEEQKAEDEVVRTKRYYLRAMSVEEAVFQLDMVDHSFYVFKNKDTDEVNIVYKREDDGIGVIEAVVK